MAKTVLRATKLKSKGNLRALNDHVQRTRPTPNADEELTHLNTRYRGSRDLAADVQARLNQLPGEPRKNAVLAVEHLLSFSPDFIQLHRSAAANGSGMAWLSGSPEDMRKLDSFCERSLAWLDKRYGAENVVNVRLHMDERTAHLHAIVVPIDERGKLNCRAFLGGRECLEKMQSSFAEEMAPLGLERGTKGSIASHQDVKRFYAAIAELTPGLEHETAQLRLAEHYQRHQQTPDSPQRATIYYRDEQQADRLKALLHAADAQVVSTDLGKKTMQVRYHLGSEHLEDLHQLLSKVANAPGTRLAESQVNFRRREQVTEQRAAQREKDQGKSEGYDL